MPWSILLLAGLPLVWLIPQHYLPWLAAHQDVAALALASVAGLLSRSPQALPLSWAVAIAVAVISVVLQFGLGLITFGGDAWMAALYLLAFAGAIAVGCASGSIAKDTSQWLDVLALSTTIAALLSVAVALMQWTGADALPLPVYGLSRGDRPYANFGQSNNFSTALFLGLCASCWLRESKRIGAVGWTVAAGALLLGMTMSGSRTASLQLALAAGLVAWVGRRTSLPQIRVRHALAMLLALAAMTLAWPFVNEALLLSGDRSLSEQTQAGLRVPIWLMALDAISRQPLLGYGWQQIPSAEWSVALEHATLQRYVEHAHNLVLDLMLWTGVPLGVFLSACIAWALWCQARAIDDARAMWLFIGVVGFFAHALLEMPHAYAYLLIPIGVAIGIVHAMCPGQRTIRLSPRLSRPVWLAIGAGVAISATDYLSVELNYRTARLESTFGDRQIVTPAPDLRVLSQLQAFLWLIRFEARPNMSPVELNAVRETTRRFAHPPALLRLALAEGLNGNPEAAQDALRRLCAMHTPMRCIEGRDAWMALQQQFPALGAVAPPRNSSHP